MKKLLLTILLFSIPSCTPVFAYDSVNLRTIARIESQNDTTAFNSRTRATGLYQITPICLEDYNIFGKGVKYTLNDMFDAYKAKTVASWYIEKRIPVLLKNKGHDITIRNILISYNCGVECVGHPLPDNTKKYINDYFDYENN